MPTINASRPKDLRLASGLPAAFSSVTSTPASGRSPTSMRPLPSLSLNTEPLMILGPAGGTALIFLGGVATTIATGVLTDLISKLLEQKFFHKEPKPAFEIVVIQPAPGTQLLVVKGPER